MWQQAAMGGIPVDLFLPSQKTQSQQAILMLRGYHAEPLQQHTAFEQAFEKWGLPVVCPVIPGCWWLDRPTPGFIAADSPLQFLIENVMNWIETEWQVAPPQVGLLGVSTGGQGVLQLAFRHALQFPVVAAISPAIDFDSIYGRGFGIEELFSDAEEARQETAILHLHPLNWPRHLFVCSDPLDANWHSGAERLSSKLASSGIRHTRDLATSHGGHGWAYFDAMAETAVAFIAQALQADAQRC